MVQQVSSRTDAPMMIEANSISDQMLQASIGSNSLNAVQKAATWALTAVTSETSETLLTYSSTFEAVSKVLAPFGSSSICE